MLLLKQSTAVVISLGSFVDKADGITLKTGLAAALDHVSTGIMLSKNGGTLAVRHATVTTSVYDAYGNYKVTLDTTDTGTLGTLHLVYSDATTCLIVCKDFMVVPAMVYDSLVGGSDVLQVDVTQLLGTAWLTPGTAGTPDVNTKLLGGTSQTGRDIGTSVLLSSGTGTGQVKLASGYVAPNWGDVGSPTTAVVLSGTTVKTATDVETDTQDIQSRLPAALISGRMSSDVIAISGDTTAADNAESAFDGTGYNFPNTTIPTVTAITNRVTANTDQIEGSDATNQIRDSILSDATRFAGANIDAAISTRTKPADTQAAVTLVTTVTNLTNAAAAGDLTSTMKSSVLTQVNGALDAASTELASVPTTTGSLRQMIQLLFQYFRNKRTVTSSTETLFKEDVSISLGTSTVSDNGTTFTHGEIS